MSPPRAPEAGTFELRASVEGREVVFASLELWWSEAEPPDQEYPSFTLVTSAEAPHDLPRIEVECSAPEATTFRDLVGAAFALSPLSAEAGAGWVSVDFGREWKARGFGAREWVAREASLRFDDRVSEAIEGRFEALIERSAARGAGAAAVGPMRLEGRFKARAPRW